MYLVNKLWFFFADSSEPGIIALRNQPDHNTVFENDDQTTGTNSNLPYTYNCTSYNHNDCVVNNITAATLAGHKNAQSIATKSNLSDTFTCVYYTNYLVIYICSAILASQNNEQMLQIVFNIIILQKAINNIILISYKCYYSNICWSI